MDHICAIIVTHNPDINTLKRSIDVTIDQVDHLIIVDNGSADPFVDAICTYKSISTVLLKGNKGIAAALNIGIRKAISEGYQYVLLLDHDSIPSSGMVSRLSEVFDMLACSGIRVSAIGPRHRDMRTSHTSRFISFDWFHFNHICASEGESIVPADFLISSGSFYDLSVFNHVGFFNEAFFIDHVDTEWFHRARNLGYHAFGVWDVVMEHSLGERALLIRLNRKRLQPIHKPFRLYYITRNSILMYRMPHAPLKWKTGDAMRLLRLITVYLSIIPNRKSSFLFIARGIADGIRGISGPIK